MVENIHNENVETYYKGQINQVNPPDIANYENSKSGVTNLQRI